jgi:hypothetical protein
MRPVISKLFIGQLLYYTDPYDQTVLEGRVGSITPYDKVRIEWDRGRLVYHYGPDDVIWKDIIINCPGKEST